MAEFNPDIYFNKYRKHKLVLLILLPLLAAGSIIGLLQEKEFFIVIRVICVFLLFIDIGIVVAFLSKKFYNWIIGFLIIVIVAIIFKNQRWPLSSEFFTWGYGGLGTVSLLLSVTFLKRYQHNSFLRYIGFFSSIVLFFTSLGVLWRTNHWPFTQFMLSFGMILFIPFLFAFVMTLPNANFVNWAKSDRTVFFRAIIVPMIFLYFVALIIIVFPDFWTTLLRSDLQPFGMDSIELIEKAGLQ